MGAHASQQLDQKQYRPGYYRVIRDNVLVRTSAERTSAFHSFLVKGEILHVSEVEVEGARVRGRLKRGGWFTIANLESGFDFVEKLPSPDPGFYVVTVPILPLHLRKNSDATSKIIASRVNGSVIEIVGITEVNLKIWGFVEGDNGGWVLLLDMKTGKWNVRFLALDSGVMIQGWLQKQGWFKARYVDRFVVLHKTGAVEYFNKENKRNSQGKFVLTASTELGMHDRAPFGFFLKCNRQQWFFSAPDWQSLRQWTREIESLIDFARSQKALMEGKVCDNELSMHMLSEDPDLVNISFFNVHQSKIPEPRSKPLKVISISGRISSGLNELSFEYSDHSKRVYGGAWGQEVPRIQLQDDEFLVQVATWYSHTRTLGTAVRFKTNKNRTIGLCGTNLQLDPIPPDREWSCAPGKSIIDIRFNSQGNIIGIIEQRPSDFTSSEQKIEQSLEFDEEIYFSICGEDGGKLVRQESMPSYDDVEQIALDCKWMEDIFRCSTFSKETFLIIWGFAGIRETQFWEFDIEDIPLCCSERALFYLIYATPDILHIYNWRRLYRLGEHGSSMTTFYNAASQTQESILLVKTRGGRVIGAFFTHTLTPTQSFTGSGKNFAFFLNDDSSSVNIYHASYEKEYYQRCTNDAIFVGGPTPCIYLTGNFSRGTCSGKGRTFKNTRPLTHKADFEILDIELWAPSFD